MRVQLARYIQIVIKRSEVKKNIVKYNCGQMGKNIRGQKWEEFRENVSEMCTSAKNFTIRLALH